MKNLTLLLLCISFSTTTYSQGENKNLDILALHNWSSNGRDLEIGIDKYFNKNVFHVGISVFQNDALSGLNAYERYFRADNFTQKIGLNLAYKRSIKFENSDLELLPKFEIQVFNTGSVLRFEDFTRTYGSRFSFNNAVGLDGKVRVFNQLYLNGGIEGGILLEDNSDNTLGTLDDWGPFSWNLTVNFSVGLMYRMNEN